MAKSKKQQKKEAEPVEGLGPAVQKAPPVKKLSSKIMDMKFMQRAQAKEEEREQEEEQQRIKDSSQWSISQHETKPVKPSKATMNYTEILSDEAPVSGRRSWGNFNVPKESEEEEKKEFELIDDPDANDSPKSLKRRNTDSKSNKKKKAKKN